MVFPTEAERAAKLRAAVQEQTDALKELAQHTKGAAVSGKFDPLFIGSGFGSSFHPS